MATERYSHNEVPAVAGVVPSTQPYALNWSRAILGGLVGTVNVTGSCAEARRGLRIKPPQSSKAKPKVLKARCATG